MTSADAVRSARFEELVSLLKCLINRFDDIDLELADIKDYIDDVDRMLRPHGDGTRTRRGRGREKWQ